MDVITDNNLRVDESVFRKQLLHGAGLILGAYDARLTGRDGDAAATGPALEAYSQHPVVKKANKPTEIMTVTEFLNQVRRLVVDYVVGQVLSGGHAGDGDHSLS